MAQAIARVIAQKEPITGENIRQAIFDIKTFNVMLPAVFATNTAAMEIDIARIQDAQQHVVQAIKLG